MTVQNSSLPSDTSIQNDVQTTESNIPKTNSSIMNGFNGYITSSNLKADNGVINLIETTKSPKDETYSIQQVKSLSQTGAINKICVCDTSSTKIATISSIGSINIFDFESDKDPRVIQGHSKEGHAIDWNKNNQKLLLTGAIDKNVRVFDISMDQEGPRYSYERDAIINDVQWQPSSDNTFLVVDNKGNVSMYDTNTETGVVNSFKAHDRHVKGVAFSSFRNNLFVTVGSDPGIVLWDLRNCKNSLHEFIDGDESVNKVKWNPSIESCFATSSKHSGVSVWDLNLIGTNDTRTYDDDDLLQGSELIFKHVRNVVDLIDFDWISSEPFSIAQIDSEYTFAQYEIYRNLCQDEDREWANFF